MIENETLAEAAAVEDAAEPVVAEETPDAEAMETEAPVEGRAKLILKRSGTETDQVFEFGSGAILGRFDPAVGPIDIDLGPLEEGVYVSRKHAQFSFEDGEWSVEDLGSSNGTFVLRGDFERVESAALTDGDEISFGNARFVFRVA
jgi:hypothetical protein